MNVQNMEDALEAWDIHATAITPITQGLINASWKIQTKTAAAFILQKLNPIFPPEIHGNIDCVHDHLERKSFRVPRLVPTVDGKHYHILANGDCYRLWPYWESTCFSKIPSVEVAFEAGRLVSQYHLAMRDFSDTLVTYRAPTHVPTRHFDALAQALNQHQNHAVYGLIEPVARQCMDMLSPLIAGQPKDHIVAHGDLKISNLLFNEDHIGLTLIDWDTVSDMPWLYEMGDAMRSWCNASLEDEPPRFSQDIYDAAIEGYQTAWPDNPWPWDKLKDATCIITLELAARFLKDALTEDYFSWNPERFESHSAHSFARGQAMVELGLQLRTSVSSADGAI